MHRVHALSIGLGSGAGQLGQLGSSCTLQATDILWNLSSFIFPATAQTRNSHVRGLEGKYAVVLIFEGDDIK